MEVTDLVSRWRVAVTLAMTLLILLGACSSAEPVNLENLGLLIDTQIQAGSAFEIAVPMDADTTVSVVSAPPGVTAEVSRATGGESILLSLVVDSDAPRGGYYLALRVERGGEITDLNWPFEVVESVATTAPEALRDEVIAAIAAKDAEAVRSLWPSSSWDSLGADVIANFVPPANSAPCNRLSDISSQCFTFEQDAARVLELTLELQGADGWTITAVSLDSTN